MLCQAVTHVRSALRVATIALALLLMLGIAQSSWAQTPPPGTDPLNIFKNYFVTGDYVVAGWVETSSNGTYATGSISFPDPKNPAQGGLPTMVPTGADIVAAYLYWGTVEGSKTTFQGQKAFFNGYNIVGDVLGNNAAPTSWSSGGCTGGSLTGSKTIRFYRADVRPYLPVDTNPSNSTYGYSLANGPFQVQLADSGSNGNTQPNALGATLVIIYRVLNPPTPLNAIVLYDGSFAPYNTAPNVSQTMKGFYQPNASPTAKLTHIVANGQPNKGETVSFGPDPNNFGPNNVLPPLYTAIYGQNSPPFPGLYGMWDNPTWGVGSLMTGGTSGFDTSETTTIVPASSGSGCVDWGAMILSTTVQDTDGDGLLDVWETPDSQGNQGYTDAVSNQWVALPGANPNQKDIFVELDYLNNLDGSAGPYLHSHLPKQAALDAVGNAFFAQGINVHFDVGNVYQSPADSYIISNGTGGNAISEGTLLCTDNGTPPLCPFPGQPAVAWKGGFAFVRDTASMPNTNPPAPLGNFQPGRGQSYHYVLSGHSLGEPRSFWSTYGAALADPTVAQLLSIMNSGTNATVTIQTPLVLSPQGVTVNPKPGDCANALIVGCSDLNNGRVTITGALLAPFVPGTAPQPTPPLNGTYAFKNASPTTDCNPSCVIGGVTVNKTTFTITTSGVANGTYNFSNEPQLAVTYLGPTSSSGHSDFGGGGDSAVMLGLWPADDVANCQRDPTQPPGAGYCNNQVGTTNVQIGTLSHELGHTLTLTHGGTYYNDPIHTSFPTYEVNCKPNFLSVMSYLFQVRGFVDGGFDYSGQSLGPLTTLNGAFPFLNEAYPLLSESLGIGSDMSTGQPAAHLTRWYSAPNALDNQLQDFAKAHCDGTPLTSADVPAVRVDGTVATGGNFSAPLDWNNDLMIDAIASPGVDVNYNGILSTNPANGDPAFSGFNDWQILNPTPTSGVALQQMSARAGAFEFSGSGGAKSGSGGAKSGSGGIDNQGGGAKSGSGGAKSGSGGAKSGSGGIDQNQETACSIADPPFLQPPVLNNKSVVLNWTPQGQCPTFQYDVWRATGSFPTLADVLANRTKFKDIQTLGRVNGGAPTTTYTDSNVKNNTTYTYFVTATNMQGAQKGAQSGPSNPRVFFVKF